MLELCNNGCRSLGCCLHFSWQGSTDAAGPCCREAGGCLLAASAALLLGVLGPLPVRCTVVAPRCASAAGRAATGDSSSTATAPCQSPLAICAAVTAPSLASSCPSAAQRTTDTLSMLHTCEWLLLLGKRSCSARSEWGSCQDSGPAAHLVPQAGAFARRGGGTIQVG